MSACYRQLRNIEPVRVLCDKAKEILMEKSIVQAVKNLVTSTSSFMILQSFSHWWKGRTCLTWAGTIPRLIVWDPELMKEVLNGNLGHFQKPPMNPHIKLLACGVASLEGDEWSKRQKTITPAFHLEKIKGMVPAFLASSVDLKKRWEELVGAEGSCELDVWPEFQNMTGDVISRTAFGSNFEEGKKIFRLQIDQSIPLFVGFVT